ncbi:MAG: VirB4-like conjugal transfer ATPase, CD1110 family [Wujia sp.]
MSLKIIEKQGYTKLKIPRKGAGVQDLMPVKSIHDDGMMELGKNQYSMTYEMKDIDYTTLDEEDQKTIFFKYSDILNSFSGKGSSSSYKITIFKKNRNRREILNRKLLRTDMGDGYDNLRMAYNDLRMDDLTTSEKEISKYLTITSIKKDADRAKSYFNRMERDLGRRFKNIRSRIDPLDADDRLHLLHDFYRCGREEDYIPYTMLPPDADIRNGICPDGMEFHGNYFRMGKKYGRVLNLRQWSRNVKDDFIHELSQINTNFIITYDIIALSPEDIDSLLEDKDSDVEASVTTWSYSKNARENRAAIVPRRLKRNRKVLDEYNEDIHERDQKIFLCQLEMVILADSMDELEGYTESVTDTASEFTCQMGIAWFMQYEGLINVLPYGLRTVQQLRDCNTETTAMIMPFNAQKLQHDTGIPYGRQIATGEQVFVDKRLLMNGNEIALGKSGSGKSMNEKLKIMFLALLTTGYIIIVDPDGEYSPVAGAIGGNIVRMGYDHINAMDMYDGYGYGKDPLMEKSNFILTLIERILNNNDFFDERKKSLVDRCITLVYGTYADPTLQTFYDVMCAQPEPEARDMALALERHICGNFSVFAHQTDVRFTSRIICFDLSQLPEQLKDAGMHICLDYINNILAMNRYQGVATNIFIDELDYFLKHESSRNMIETFFQRIRKYGGFCTGLIQNVKKMLDIPAAKTMLKNSENIIMMGQEKEDASILADMYNLSAEDVAYLIDAEPGFGINKIGKNIFQFDGTIPKTNLFYRYINTDGHSIAG